MKYAILDENGQVYDVRDFDALPPHKSGRVLPIVNCDIPAFDILTQRVVPGDYVVETTRVIQTWRVEPLPVYRVTKDTLYQRVKAAGKRSELNAFLRSLPADDYEEFTQSAWFSSDNAQIRQGIEAIGLKPDEIMAPDPLAP